MENYMNTINNTISFTPSNEQLIAIAKDHPELNQKIKNSVVEALEKNAVKYIQNRLQSKANTAYDNLYQEVQKNFFSGHSYHSNKSGFTATIEEKFKLQVEEALANAVQEEFDSYINSPEFKRTLRVKVQEKIVTSAIKLLDEQILEETKKLIA